MIAAALPMPAQLHAYSHDSPVPSASAGLADAGVHGPRVGTHARCIECLAFAPLLCAAGAPVSLPPLPQADAALAPGAAVDSLIDHVLTLAFQACAPPAAPRV